MSKSLVTLLVLGLTACGSPSPSSSGTDQETIAEDTPVDVAVHDACEDVGGRRLVTASPTVFVDTAPGAPPLGPIILTAALVDDKGEVTDVTARTVFTLDDPSIGTIVGNVLTMSKLGSEGLPGSGLGIDVGIHARYCGLDALGTVVIVPLRKTGDKRDFFFSVPYLGTPSPDRDILKMGTTIKRADIALVMDTTDSMGKVIANLKANLTTTIQPSWVKSIPGVGIAIAHHDDYPVGPFGSTGCGTMLSGDVPARVVQAVTTDIKKVSGAANLLEVHCGGDAPDSQLPALQHVLTGSELTWPGGSVAKHVPASGTTGGVDFRAGSLAVVVQVTDGEGNTGYSFAAPTLSEVKSALVAANARFVSILDSSAPTTQANALSDATKSAVSTKVFGSTCAVGQCCTGVGFAARAPDAPGGRCRLAFATSDGSIADALVRAIQAIAIGSTFDVSFVASNDPANPPSVDASKFVKTLRAMSEGDAGSGCPAATAKDTDGDAIEDTFVAVPVGTPLCVEVIPRKNDFLPATGKAQFLNAFIDTIGMPGSVSLDRRTVLFIVPP